MEALVLGRRNLRTDYRSWARKGDRLIFTWTGGTEKVEIGAALKSKGHVRSWSRGVNERIPALFVGKLPEDLVVVL